MPRLSKLEFCILNAVADGSEPFSMIYQDITSNGCPDWDMEAIAHSVCYLVSLGLLELGEKEPETSGGFVLDPDTLLNHYETLEKELEEVERPFYYSKGEYFFQMSSAGMIEWNKEEYLPFYTG